MRYGLGAEDAGRNRIQYAYPVPNTSIEAAAAREVHTAKEAF